MHRLEEMNTAKDDMATLCHLSAGVAGQTACTKKSLATVIIRNMLRPGTELVNDELIRIEEELELVADLAGQIIDQLAISCAALAEAAAKLPPAKTGQPEIPIYNEGEPIPDK